MEAEQYTIPQAAKLLNVPEDSLRKTIEVGALPFSHDGETILISKFDVERIVQGTLALALGDTP